MFTLQEIPAREQGEELSSLPTVNGLCDTGSSTVVVDSIMLLSQQDEDILGGDNMMLSGDSPSTDLIELTRLIELETTTDPQLSSKTIIGSCNSSTSGSSSRDGSVWSEDEKEINSSTAPNDSSCSQLMMSNILDLNCNDENFSCFNESILFADEDELERVNVVHSGEGETLNFEPQKLETLIKRDPYHQIVSLHSL